MKFQYHPHLDMDDVPAPKGKMLLSGLGLTLGFVLYIFLWAVLLGWRI